MSGAANFRSARAVFLDRDGVINRAGVRDGRPYPPQRFEDLEILPGVAETLRRLRVAGFLNIVATNQPDVATGRQERRVVDAIHNHLRASLALDDVRACFCVEGPNCPCYKPAPGLLLEAARDWGIDLARSFMVGDRWRDVGAGKAAGCRTIFIDRGYTEPRPDNPDFIVSDLSEAGRIILDSAISSKRISSKGGYRPCDLSSR